MLTVHALVALGRCWTCLDANTLHEGLPCKITYVNHLINSNPICTRHAIGRCFRRLQSSSHHILLQEVPKRFLCRLKDPGSSDDEYRSSRNIATALFRRYRNVIDRGEGGSLKEFISAAVNAYVLGCADEDLRKEWADMKENSVEIEAMQNYGGSTSLKSKIASGEIDECILWLSITFITILCTPQPTIIRLSSTPPVSEEVVLQWKGYCALIANAYFVRGMAW